MSIRLSSIVFAAFNVVCSGTSIQGQSSGHETWPFNSAETFPRRLLMESDRSVDPQVARLHVVPRRHRRAYLFASPQPTTGVPRCNDGRGTLDDHAVRQVLEHGG